MLQAEDVGCSDNLFIRDYYHIVSTYVGTRCHSYGASQNFSYRPRIYWNRECYSKDIMNQFLYLVLAYWVHLVTSQNKYFISLKRLPTSA